MNTSTFRQFTIVLGSLPINRLIPRYYSRKETKAILKEWLTLNFETLIAAGVFDRRGTEDEEVQELLEELMDCYDYI